MKHELTDEESCVGTLKKPALRCSRCNKFIQPEDIDKECNC